MITVCVMCGKIIHGASHPAACGACASRIVPLVPKPTIKLRIRVGVTRDGTWIAAGSSLPNILADVVGGEGDAAFNQVLAEDGAGPVVAWHWITAEVPMPEVERGEVAGEVER